MRVRLRPLTEREAVLFLDKHMRAAGAIKNLVEPDAATLLFQHSRGIPRHRSALLTTDGCGPTRR